MYRIRSASGNEVSYNSLEEFSAAVRRGEVHPEDEIFHTRANRWLDVKSHPHYRSATTWHGHEPAAATAPRAPAQPSGSPATPARPASSAPAQSPSSSRVQVFERPQIRPAQRTTVRPQLQPEPAPASGSGPAAAPSPDAAPVAPPKPEAPQRYGPPKKSKELAFIDLGDSPPAKPKSAVAEPAAPAQVPPRKPEAAEPKPEVKPVAEQRPAAPPAPPTGPGSEVEFLVMDAGLESPVRTSAGYKAAPEDLNLLFDAPLPQTTGPAPEPVRGVAVVGVPPKGPPAQRPAKVPVVQAAPSPAPAPAPAEPAPTPEKPVTAAVVTHTPSVPAAPAVAPPVAASIPSSPSPVDLSIPSGPLLETPVAPAVRAPASHTRAGRPNVLMLGGGIAVVAVAGILLAWRPWQGGSSVAEATAQPTAPAATALVGPPAPTPIRTTTTTTPSGKAGAAAKPGDAAAGANADSGGDDEVIAVAKPKFRTDVAVPVGADLGVGPAWNGGAGNASASPSELAERLVAAERQAQQELTRRLSALGFNNVLAPGRLGTASGVNAARTTWNAGADAIRQYRGRLARLESAYEDSVLAVQRAQRWPADELRAWASRQSFAEPAETSQLADLMFSQVSEGLDILAALDGNYSIRGQRIAFRNAATATRYTSIRGWVEQRTSSWAGTPERARPYSVTAILHALGEGFPAAE